MLLPYSSHGEWGYLTRAGEVAIAPRFGWAGSFDTGLARVSPIAHAWDAHEIISKGAFAYIDETGGFALPERFDQACDVSEGLGCVNVDATIRYAHYDGREYFSDGQWGYDVVVPRLVQSLSDVDESVIVAAMHALYGFGSDASPAIPALITRLARAECRGIGLGLAQTTLAGIGATAVPALANALAHENALVRIGAAEALAFIHEDAAPAAPALIAALEDPSTRPYAAEALRSIGESVRELIPARWTRVVDEAHIDRSLS